MYSSTNSYPRHCMGLDGLLHTQAALLSRKNPLVRRLNGPQSRGDAVAKREFPFLSWGSNPGRPARKLLVLLIEISRLLTLYWPLIDLYASEDRGKGSITVQSAQLHSLSLAASQVSFQLVIYLCTDFEIYFRHSPPPLKVRRAQVFFFLTSLIIFWQL
jgi:hypothetical protein